MRQTLVFDADDTLWALPQTVLASCCPAGRPGPMRGGLGVARVLGRLRISNDTEASTAIEGQKADIQKWADDHGHVVVGWAEDRDVSGSVDPFKAPQLGPWLNRHGEWDILVAWKLDRLGRGLFDLVNLHRWCQDNGKGLACVRDAVDLSTPMGRFVFVILAGIAEMEREAIRSRVAAQRERTRQSASYNGGSYPFGYRPLKRTDGAGWTLVPDPDDQRIVAEIFEKACSQSARSICRDLNSAGTPAPNGGEWGTSTILNMVRNRSVLGYVLHDGKLVTDSKGEPVRRDPLVSADLFDRANAALGRQRPLKRTYDTPLLSGLAFCAVCNAPMYPQRQTVKGKLYEYYKCSTKTSGDGDRTCLAKVVPMGVADGFVESQVLSFGPLQRFRQVRVSSDHEIREADLTARISALLTEQADLDDDDDALTGKIRDLKAERKALRSEPVVDRWEYRPTGETWGEAWERSDVHQRRAMLTEQGARFELERTGREAVRVRGLVGAGCDRVDHPGHVCTDDCPSPKPFNLAVTAMT